MGSRTHGRDTFLCADKESIQKKTALRRLLPALRRFYRGLLEGTPVPPANYGIPAAPLRAIPDKTASARRGIRGRVESVGWGELVNPNMMPTLNLLGSQVHPNLTI